MNDVVEDDRNESTRGRCTGGRRGDVRGPWTTRPRLRVFVRPEAALTDCSREVTRRLTGTAGSGRGDGRVRTTTYDGRHADLRAGRGPWGERCWDGVGRDHGRRGGGGDGAVCTAGRLEQLSSTGRRSDRAARPGHDPERGLSR